MCNSHDTTAAWILRIMRASASRHQLRCFSAKLTFDLVNRGQAAEVNVSLLGYFDHV